MKYSLRSLTLAVGLGPPLLAGLYVLVTQSLSWEVWAILAGWLIIFCLMVAYSARVSVEESKGAFCSFCHRWQSEIGEMAESGAGGIFICYPCASLCKDLIERECRKRGIEPINHDWPEDALPNSTAPAPNPPKE